MINECKIEWKTTGYNSRYDNETKKQGHNVAKCTNKKVRIYSTLFFDPAHTVFYTVCLDTSFIKVKP